MATVISIRKQEAILDELSGRKNECIEKIRRFLPDGFYGDVLRSIDNLLNADERVEEIRLRCGMNVCVTVGGKSGRRNAEIQIRTSENYMSEIVRKMCDGSMYAYGESIIKGYISLDGGVRVGVCGHATVERGKILGVYNISALNIRFPSFDVNVDTELIQTVKKAVKRGEGVLIYSPPSQGKTTFLRSLALALSSGEDALRTVVVDTREELSAAFSGKNASVDIMSGYPQAEGIRIATAFMNPQVIICDEIGSEEDALAIAQAQNCGVPLVATAHGASIDGILKRKGMAYLHSVGAFGLYVGIEINGYNGFHCCVHNRGETDDAIFGDVSNSVRRNRCRVFFDSRGGNQG